MDRVRPAIKSDAIAIARIDIDCWRASYAGLVPDKLLLHLDISDRRRVWTHHIGCQPEDTFVGLDGHGRIQGFGNCGAARETINGLAGEVFTLYVAPDYQGFGLGRLMLHAMFRRLVQQGLSSAAIWVLRQNPSRYFYERLGGKLAGFRRIAMRDTDVEAVAYAWPDLPAFLAALPRTSRLTREN